MLMPVLINLNASVRPGFSESFLHYKVSLTLGVIALFAWEIKQRHDSQAPAIGLLGGALVVLVTYAVTSRFLAPSFDLKAYVRASDSIAHGTNPYVKQKGGYLYPPLLAESVYLLRAELENAGKSVETPAKEHPKKAAIPAKGDPKKAATAAKGHAQKAAKEQPAKKKKADKQPSVFFSLWCGLQLIAAALVYASGYKLARRLGAGAVHATALPLALLLGNHAYWKTLENGQVNLILTAVFLVAMLCAAEHPFVSGLAIAIGTHLKVYPGFLLGAWTLSGRWRVTAYALLCFGVIFGLQLAFFDPSIWKQYLHFASQAPQQVRGGSLATVSIISFTFGNGKAVVFAGKSWSLAAYVTAAAYAGILLIMGERFLRRESIWRKRRRELGDSLAAATEDKFRIMGHATDAVVLPLLISPIVWNHHYVVLVPVLIWSTLLLGSDRLQVWLPVAAVLFPVFGRPFIYICYAGIWLWIYQTSPQAIWNAIAAQVTTRDEPSVAEAQAPIGSVLEANAE
jgi:hypothetical protein